MSQQQQPPRLHPEIPGWGADLDHKDRPAVPKERTPPRFINPHWVEIEQQIPRVKIFKSIERPTITPVFGTSMPPSGLSGLIRGAAYKLSENDVRHWFMLLFADRVNVVEGIFSDLLHGRIPNILGEMGIRAELKYNKRGLVKKVLVTAGLFGLSAMYLKRRRYRKAFALK